MTRVFIELRRGWQFVRLFALICSYHFVKLVGNLIDRREGFIEQRVACLMSRRILHVLRMRVEVSGTEHVTGLDRFCIVANHFSYFDWVLLLGYFPSPISFIAKREVTFMPVFGSYLRNRGVLIDRKRGATARKVIAEAAESSPWPLVIFPEGTRSEGGEMQSFRRAGIRILADAGLVMVPCNLLGTHHALGKRDRAIKRGQLVKLEILPPIDPREVGPEQACELVEERIRAAFDARSERFR